MDGADLNPYKAPQSSDGEQAGETRDPLLGEILRFQPWASLAGLSVLIAGAGLIGLMLYGGATGTALLPVVVFAVGGGILGARLLLLGRAVRRAAVTPTGVDDCLRQVRKVFSHVGVLGSIYFGIIVLMLAAVVLLH